MACAWFGVIVAEVTRLCFVVSSFLLTLNWGLFVYALQAGRAVEAALGYFIYPLIAVVLGILLLGEKLDRLGWISSIDVVCGVFVKMGLRWSAADYWSVFGCHFRPLWFDSEKDGN